MNAYQLIRYEASRDAMRNVLLGENNPLDISPLNADLNSADKGKSALEYIREYDLSKLMPPHRINDSFPCHFFPGNLAWISEHQGHFRYFSKGYNGYVHSYDLFDFLYLYYDTENIGSIIKLLSNKAGVIFLDKRWRAGQREKYLRNIQWSTSALGDSLYLEKVLGPHLELYRQLNAEGLRHLGPMNLSLHRDAMFFVSSRYLGEKLHMSASKVSRVCLYLEMAGLLTRVPDEAIPEQYLEKARECSGRKVRINYYCIRDIEKNLDFVEKQCREMLNAGLRFSMITNKHLSNPATP